MLVVREREVLRRRVDAECQRDVGGHLVEALDVLRGLDRACVERDHHIAGCVAALVEDGLRVQEDVLDLRESAETQQLKGSR